MENNINETMNLNNDVEPILPDGFDSTDENFSVDKFFAEPTADDHTTEEPQTVEDAPAVEQPTEEPVATETEPTTAPVVEAKQQTIKVKFNHEERDLSLEEAALFAQKGMNYDKLEERLKSFEATNAKNEALAKNLGYSNATEMIEAAEKNYYERQVRELVEAGNTEAMARFLVEQKMAKAAVPVQEVSQPQQSKPNSESVDNGGISAERKAELNEFINAYPGVTKLPDEVVAANRSGVRLLVAYERYKNKVAQNELNILKQNQAAAAKAPVTGATGKAAPEAQKPADPFLAGFDKDF